MNSLTTYPLYFVIAIGISYCGATVVPCNIKIPCTGVNKPVCGHDGKTYTNECMMKRKACERREPILGVYDEVCDTIPCQYKIYCMSHNKPLCGHDGKTYMNKCMMKRASCIEKRAITSVYEGTCFEIKSYNCQFPCPSSRSYQPVCGSDGTKYMDECALRRASCRRKLPITIVYTPSNNHESCPQN